MMPTSPLARFMLAMVLLALAGSCMAGAHWYAVDLPDQENLEEYTKCTGRCVSSNAVYMSPVGPRTPGDDSCRKACREQYPGRRAPNA